MNEMKDESILSMPIGDMDVSVRLRNCLKAADCETVGDVVKYDKIHFLKQRNFGKRSLSELITFLEDHNLAFAMPVDPEEKASPNEISETCTVIAYVQRAIGKNINVRFPINKLKLKNGDKVLVKITKL